MSVAAPVRRWQRADPLRVGLFGLLGSGNLGNDGSLQAMLGYLAAEHPDAELSAMCGGPEQVRDRYGIQTTRLHWYRAEYRTAARVSAIAGKALGKVVDAVRTANWVRRQDVVIVPGMGVLEATLPLRPWGFPYSLLLLCASGRLFGTKVALVSVGAELIGERVTRALVTRAARLADYRSYRDERSRSAMRRMGVDTSADEVYPDLAFALPIPAAVAGRTGAVGVGVMAFRGDNTERGRADQVYRAYTDKITGFVRWLVDNDRGVRLFIGDQADQEVVDQIVADLRLTRPDLPPGTVTGVRTSTLGELIQQMSTVDAVVATRYHNVLCALKLGKPTLSLGYAAKNDVLMAGMGLGEFCQPVREIDLDRLTEQFTALRDRADELRATLAERNLAAAHRLDRQFAVLSAELLPVPRGVR